MEALIEFGKLIIPASIVLYAAYLLVRSFILREIELKKLEVRGRSIETILPNRLQAFERMTLFLERMSPQNLLVRLTDPQLTLREFHQLLLSEIRNEYNHNVSQQIYISSETWELIKGAREDLIVLINESANELHPESSALELSKKIVEKTISRQVDPISHAINALKAEIQQVF